MSTITQAKLDPLFTPVKSPLNEFHMFLKLPAELKNAVYTYYFTTALTNINITPTGRLAVPSLLLTSKEVHAETKGYFCTWLATAIHDDTIPMTAQIANYNSAPLAALLQSLSRTHNITVPALALHLRTELVGEEYNFKNLLRWVEAHIADANSMPAFIGRQDKMPYLLGIGYMDPLSGSHSVTACVRGFRESVLKGKIGASWTQGASFLELVQHMGVTVAEYDKLDRESTAMRVFEVVGGWHHELHEIQIKGKTPVWQNRMADGTRDHLQIDAVMACVVWRFWAA